MINLLTTIVGALNFFPGIKTKAAAVAAFGLAVVQAWNAAAPAVGLSGLEVHIPPIVDTLVLATLGIGAANQLDNAKR